MTCELLRAYTARSEKHRLRLGLFSNGYMNLATVVSFGLLTVILVVPALRAVFSVATVYSRLGYHFLASSYATPVWGAS